MIPDSNPHRAREAATDVLLLLAGQGIQRTVADDVAGETARDLCAKCEWALETLGVSAAEIWASVHRVRALAAATRTDFDAELRGLLGDDND